MDCSILNNKVFDNVALLLLKEMQQKNFRGSL